MKILGKFIPVTKQTCRNRMSHFMSARCVDENAKVSGENHLIEEYCATFSKNSTSFCLDKPSENCCSNAKSNEDSWLQELESIADESFERAPMSKDLKESWHSNANLMYLDRERPEKNCSDLDSQWSEFMKIEPWWHSADKGDVASFISRRSSSDIRNCDLPEPQALHFEKGSDNFVNCFGQVKEQMANTKARILLAADCSQGKDAGLVECTFQGSDGTFSNGNLGTIKVDSSVTPGQESFDLNKTQLLEALCHSQTCAREAEKLAQDACDEKGHMIELFSDRHLTCLLISSGSEFCKSRHFASNTRVKVTSHQLKTWYWERTDTRSEKRSRVKHMQMCFCFCTRIEFCWCWFACRLDHRMAFFSFLNHGFCVNPVSLSLICNIPM